MDHFLEDNKFSSQHVNHSFPLFYVLPLSIQFLVIPMNHRAENMMNSDYSSLNLNQLLLTFLVNEYGISMHAKYILGLNVLSVSDK